MSDLNEMREEEGWRFHARTFVLGTVPIAGVAGITYVLYRIVQAVPYSGMDIFTGVVMVVGMVGMAYFLGLVIQDNFM